MFSKQTYVNRRNELKRRVNHGIILLFGNNEAPCNYPNNAYYPFRQDSSFLYYFGQNRDGLVGVIDVDANCETLSATTSTLKTSCGMAQWIAWPTWPPRWE